MRFVNLPGCIVIQETKNINYIVLVRIVSQAYLLIVVQLYCLYSTVHCLPLWTENLDEFRIKHNLLTRY